ncbi:MAG: 4-aminobutyrate--2-oxoglutarate transaminase [Rhodanobacter sp.]|nr:MAG: 4-aminobutyrate--2-oxoglutarate transaminase [Rhodanobacter sp.]TAM40210.1 MAG: 4-aminobutyrate--2-oxoglutarate transaminase [Rhodanobacter sp.]
MTGLNQQRQDRKYGTIPIGVASNFFAKRAWNAELWDAEGKRYIDFAAGTAVANTGRCRPRIVEAIAAQLRAFTLTHTAFQVAPYTSYIELAEKVNHLTPGTHAKKTAFFTTGAEAVENAIKIARAATGRTAVIAFAGAFHGRTFMGMALTGKVAPHKQDFGPLPGELYHIPFPTPLDGITTQDSLKALDMLFKADISPKRVAAIIIEPVQGEGGFNVAPTDFLQALRERCDEHGILLIVDEVQTGFARTGRMFAVEHSGVVPDLITMAKSLADGMSLSGVCGRAHIMDTAPRGSLGGMYGGNPLALASGLAVLDIIQSEGLVARAEVLGERLRAALAANKHPHVAEVRGLGAMIAAEFRDPATGKPDPETAARIQRRAMEQGLILPTCGSYGNVIRFLVPLTIPDSVLEEGLAILREEWCLEASVDSPARTRRYPLMSAVPTAEPLVRFQGVQKSYDGSHLVVRDLNLDIYPGEFLSLLGPSGSGKTTCLMMLAGFESPTGGDIFLEGRRLNDVPPHRRNLGMVFQNYALFPHMTVERNLEYPLKVRKIAPKERTKRIMDALAMVQMQDFAKRYPAQLSGGQQQRIALARALVFQPKIVLMDEPLGALDKQLREHMQLELKALHRQLGITFVYVTHDQSEALTMSNRIAVFNQGIIQQVSRADTLYESPCNRFVAGFVGDSNQFAGTVRAVDGDSCQVEIAGEHLLWGINTQALVIGSPCIVAIRPERIVPCTDSNGSNQFQANRVDEVYFGDHVRLRCRIADSETFFVKMPLAADSGTRGQGGHVNLIVAHEHVRVFQP